jgi:outer membrane protein assembly factor BamB
MSMNSLGSAVLVMALAAAAAPSGAAPGPADWPCWRGPTHDGQADPAQRVPLEWGAAANVVWSVDVPGRGNGSPTVIGPHVFLATCDEATGSQAVRAFDRAGGKPAWGTVVHAAGAMRKNEKSTGASTTVAGDGERLYVTFPSHDAVFCTALSPDGRILWQRRVCDYVIHQGYGASPLVHGGRVFVVADHKNKGRVAALDAATGAVLWEQERPPSPNYSSPVIWRLFDREQLILTGCDKVAALDPATGDTLWERSGATTECVTTTVTDGQRVFSTGGYPRNHVAAYRADGSGTIDWENNARIYVPSLLHARGHIYAILDAGMAACWDAATGEERWKHRLGGTFSASPVMIGDVVMATNEAGETHVFRANPERMEPIAVNRLGTEALASPAVCGGRIYLRVAVTTGDLRQEKLFCIGTRDGDQQPPAE